MKNYLWKRQDIIQSFVMEGACARIKICKPKMKIIGNLSRNISEKHDIYRLVHFFKNVSIEPKS